VPLNAANLVGAVSCIFWALMLVVTLKYVILILRADNRGEGGGLALTALAAHAVAAKPALRNALLLLGVFGATLFYGDSVITPAISVLGAMEGLEVATPALKAYVVPASLAVLLGLFVVQRFGTAAVGRVFGPIIALWFVTLAVTGVMHIADQPAILAALNPFEALQFLAKGLPCPVRVLLLRTRRDAAEHHVWHGLAGIQDLLKLLIAHLVSLPHFPLSLSPAAVATARAERFSLAISTILSASVAT